MDNGFIRFYKKNGCYWPFAVIGTQDIIMYRENSQILTFGRCGKSNP